MASLMETDPSYALRCKVRRGAAMLFFSARIAALSLKQALFGCTLVG